MAMIEVILRSINKPTGMLLSIASIIAIWRNNVGESMRTSDPTQTPLSGLLPAHSVEGDHWGSEKQYFTLFKENQILNFCASCPLKPIVCQSKRSPEVPLMPEQFPLILAMHVTLYDSVFGKRVLMY